jgi:ABC-type molybdate transport system substrate-binding protein
MQKIFFLFFLFFHWGYTQEPLTLYCERTFAAPMHKIAQLYSQRYGQAVHIVQDTSQTLLEEITQTCKGDLFLPGDSKYITGYSDPDFFPYHAFVSNMELVGFAPFGNPYNVHAPQDLLRPNLRIGIGSPDLGSIGTVTRQVFEKKFNKSFYQTLARNALYFAIDSQDIIALHQQGKIDVGITWKPSLLSLLNQHKVTLLFSLHQIDTIISTLSCSKMPTQAKQFIDLIATPPAQAILKKAGFNVQ